MFGTALKPEDRLAGLPAPLAPSAALGNGRKGLFGARSFVGDPRSDAPSLPPMLPSQSSTPQGAPMSRLESLQPGTDGAQRQPLPQGFDYEAAMAQIMPPERKRSTLQKIAEFAGPALMAMGGNEEGANAFIANLHAAKRDREQAHREVGMQLAKWKYQDWARQKDADVRAAAPFSSGRDRVRYDPATGTSEVIYDGPEDFETYAQQLGYEPGSPEYFTAVEDYVLRSNGPTAYGYDIGLDDHRTGNRAKLEGVRQSNRVSLEASRQRNRLTTRQTPTYRDINPAPARQGSTRSTPRPRATNPATGEVREWDGKAWVDPR